MILHKSWLICRLCISIWGPHLQKNKPLSFQTGPRLKLPVPERNSRTIRATAARQPVLQQGSLHRRVAIICQTTTSGWIYRWGWMIRSLIQHKRPLSFHYCWDITFFNVFYYFEMSILISFFLSNHTSKQQNLSSRKTSSISWIIKSAWLWICSHHLTRSNRNWFCHLAYSRDTQSAF